MLYLTNAVGLNSAVIGTLMMVSKLLDGVSDIFFGGLMDKTKSRMGQARPWMLFGQIGVSACLFLVFCIPDMGQSMQYAYFFVFYTAFNAVFYTANSIAYAALAAVATQNFCQRFSKFLSKSFGKYFPIIPTEKGAVILSLSLSCLPVPMFFDYQVLSCFWYLVWNILYQLFNRAV